VEEELGREGRTFPKFWPIYSGRLHLHRRLDFCGSSYSLLLHGSVVKIHMGYELVQMVFLEYELYAPDWRSSDGPGSFIWSSFVAGI
jgi:hypothetical protein